MAKTTKDGSGVRPVSSRLFAPKDSPAVRAKVLEGLRAGSTFKDASEDAGVARDTVYQWRKDDSAFNTLCEAAYDEGTDVLEREAQRRAVEGMTETTTRSYTKDGVAIVEESATHRYSDTLMNIMLKGRRPGKYRDNASVELSGPNGGPINARLEVEFVTTPAGKKS